MKHRQTLCHIRLCITLPYSYVFHFIVRTSPEITNKIHNNNTQLCAPYFKYDTNNQTADTIKHQQVPDHRWIVRVTFTYIRVRFERVLVPLPTDLPIILWSFSVLSLCKAMIRSETVRSVWIRTVPFRCNFFFPFLCVAILFLTLPTTLPLLDWCRCQRHQEKFLSQEQDDVTYKTKTYMYVAISEYDCQSPSLFCPFAYLSKSTVRVIPSFYITTTTYTINTVLILIAAVLRASKLSTVSTATLLLLLTFWQYRLQLIEKHTGINRTSPAYDISIFKYISISYRYLSNI